MSNHETYPNSQDFLQKVLLAIIPVNLKKCMTLLKKYQFAQMCYLKNYELMIQFVAYKLEFS